VAQDDRTEAIRKFQQEEGTRIFLGGMLSAGAGITLTEAKHTVFLDYPWTPADHEQAAARNHRPGVKHQGLNVWQMYAKETVDEFMKNTIDGKRKVIASVFSGDSDTEDTDVLKEVTKAIKGKAGTKAENLTEKALSAKMPS